MKQTMKALVIRAEWAPKPDYKPNEWEIRERIALRANKVYKNPTWAVENDFPVPKIEPDEVMIRVKSSGVCGSDVHMLRKSEDGYTFFGGWAGFPCVPGHEFAGIVEEIGSKVDNVKPGDLVTVEEVQYCGKCDACRAGWMNCCKNMTQLGFESRNPGAMGEYIKAKDKFVYSLQPLKGAYSTDDEILEAGSLVEPTSVAYEGLFSLGGGLRNPGGHVAIFGAGPIGLACIQLLKTSGAAKIVVFEPMKARAKLAKTMGADYVFDPTKQDQSPREMIRDVTNGRGCAMLVEAAGNQSTTIPAMVGSLEAAGRIVNIGMSGERPSLDMLTLQYSEGSICGSMGHSGHGDFGNVINLMGAKRIDMRPAITSRYKLDDAVKAIISADQGNDAKVVVKL
jgi:threonine dehydrogenase-like Zn-dependent dehydrogenase